VKKQHKQRWSTIPRIYKTSIISYEPTKQFEDTKGVTRIRKSKKDRQYNGQKKKDKIPHDKGNFKIKYKNIAEA
jgi:hypothetical protein